jgi:hypothetical protein
VRFDPRKSQPEHEQIMLSLLEQETIGALSIVPKRKFGKRQSELGFMRIAYLELFIATGYQILLNRNLDPIRAQLHQDYVAPLPDSGIADPNVPDELPDIGLVIEPETLRSYFVCVKLRSALGTAFRFGVLLPLPFAPGLDIYRLSAHYNQHRHWPTLRIQPLERS